MDREMTYASKGKLYYGWVITFISWLAYIFVLSSCYYGGSVPVTEMVIKNGWNQSVIGLTSTVTGGVSMALAIPAGLMIRRFGLKKMIFISCAVACIGFSGLAFFSTGEITMLLFYAVCSLAYGIGIVAIPSVVPFWFDRNASFPMAFINTGGAVGGFVFPVIAAFMIRFSVASVWLLYAACAALTGFLVFVFFRNRPEEIGDIKDGRAWTLAHPAGADTGKEQADQAVQTGQNGQTVDAGVPVNAGKKEQIPLSAVYRSYPFYVFGLGMTCARFCNICFASYAIAYALQIGISAESAALVLSSYGLIGLAGRISSGWLSRIRLPGHIIGSILFALFAVTFFVYSRAESIAAFYFTAAFVGILNGINVTLNPLLTTEYFGAGNFPVIYGIYNTIGSLGHMAGPLMIIAVYRITGQYSTSYRIAMVLCLVTSVMFAFARKRKL